MKLKAIAFIFLFLCLQNVYASQVRQSCEINSEDRIELQNVVTDHFKTIFKSLFDDYLYEARIPNNYNIDDIKVQMIKKEDSSWFINTSLNVDDRVRGEAAKTKISLGQVIRYDTSPAGEKNNQIEIDYINNVEIEKTELGKVTSRTCTIMVIYSHVLSGISLWNDRTKETINTYYDLRDILPDINRFNYIIYKKEIPLK